MAVISKIRSYSGLLIAIIGIGLAAFVLGDLFQYDTRRGDRPDMEIANINNTSVSIFEFEERYEQQLDQWKQQTGISSPDASQTYRIRQQVWEQMINEFLLERMLEDIGVAVSGDELYELVTGPNPHPSIVQSFTNPETGEFDRQQVQGFLQNLDMMEPRMRNQWLMLEEHIRKERKEAKLQNIIMKALNVPEVFAEIDHRNKNTLADIKIIAKQYNTISDDEIDISRSELRSAYEENKFRFKREHTRDMEYVLVNIDPTQEDRQSIKEDILDLKEEFGHIEDVERFVNAVSDRRFDPDYYGENELPSEIDSVMFNSPEGTVYGAYEKDGAFIVAKLNDIQFRPDSMKASHVLVSYRGSLSDQQRQQQQQQPITRTYQQAEQKADSLLNVIRRNPDGLAEIAIQLSDDPSAMMNQGDLDWFQDGAMIPEFNNAVVEGNVGDVVLAETDYGFHIIYIDEKSPASKKVQVAKIIRAIEPGSDTYRRAFAEVSDFATEVRDKNNFSSFAEEKGFNVRKATRVGNMDNTLPGVQNAREVIRWAFNNNTEEGSISRIYDFENQLVLAKLSKINEKGIAPLDEVRNEVERIAMKEKKYKIIAEELDNALQETGSMDGVSAQLDLEINTAENLSLNTSRIPGIGREPRVIGKAIALKQDEISRPVKGENAVYMIKVTNKSEAIIPDDLTTARRNLENNLANRMNQLVDALKKDADIEDKRSSFF